MDSLELAVGGLSAFINLYIARQRRQVMARAVTVTL